MTQLNEMEMEILVADHYRALKTGKVAVRQVVRKALEQPEWTVAHQMALDIETAVIEHKAAREVAKFFASQKAPVRPLDEIIAEGEARDKKYAREMKRLGRGSAACSTCVGVYRVGQVVAVGGMIALAPVAILGSAFGWGHSPIPGIGGRR